MLLSQQMLLTSVAVLMYLSNYVENRTDARVRQDSIHIMSMMACDAGDDDDMNDYEVTGMLKCERYIENIEHKARVAPTMCVYIWHALLGTRCSHYPTCRVHLKLCL